MKFIKEITLFAPSGTLKRFQGLETSFKVEQGKISALISESELIELQNGNKTMYSRMASTEQTVKGLSQKYTCHSQWRKKRKTAHGNRIY